MEGKKEQQQQQQKLPPVRHACLVCSQLYTVRKDNIEKDVTHTFMIQLSFPMLQHTAAFNEDCGCGFGMLQF